MNKQIKLGSVIAYINIVLHMLTGVFLTPFLIRELGAGEYGVYKIIQSFSAPLAIMSFGISTLVIRNVVFYNTRKEIKEKENFLFLINKIAIFLAFLIAVVSVVLFFFIDNLYGNSLTPEELATAKKLFIILVANVALSVICDSYTGLIKAHEKFVVSNGISTLRLVLRMTSIIFLLKLGVKSIGIVLADLSITALTLIVCQFYGKLILHENAKFHNFDKSMLKSCITFSLAVFLQAIVNQINQNVDNIILGAMKGTIIVTVYSTALTLYTCFNSMVTVIGGMYGPRATKLVAEGADGEKLTDFVIKPARIQLIIASLCIMGFSLLGRDFIQLWLGEGYEDVYKITLILIVPVVIPLIESVTNNILDAEMKRMARSLILVCMCVFNIIVSVVLINLIGYIGAAYGTAFSLILGHGIIMNVYLHKKIKLNIIRMFKEVFHGILKCTVISSVTGLLVLLLPNYLYWFILKLVFLTAIYFTSLFLWGMNSAEKTYARNIAKIIKRNFIKRM